MKKSKSNKWLLAMIAKSVNSTCICIDRIISQKNIYISWCTKSHDKKIKAYYPCPFAFCLSFWSSVPSCPTFLWALSSTGWILLPNSWTHRRRTWQIQCWAMMSSHWNNRNPIELNLSFKCWPRKTRVFKFFRNLFPYEMQYKTRKDFELSYHLSPR